MHQNTRRLLTQYFEVGSSKQVVAIQNHEPIGSNMVPTTPHGVAGASGHGLYHRLPLSKVSLLLQIGFNLLRQIIDYDDKSIDRLRERPKRPIENWARLYR